MVKHRLARSLFLYGLCNGWICEGTPVVEASSGSTAVSEAYFARMLGLRFIAVVPRSTAQAKIDAIAKPGAVLATNTSTLDVNEIANATSRPESVIGTHFFSPANVMKLMENVRCAQSSDQTIATVMALPLVDGAHVFPDRMS